MLDNNIFLKSVHTTISKKPRFFFVGEVDDNVLLKSLHHGSVDTFFFYVILDDNVFFKSLQKSPS